MNPVDLWALTDLNDAPIKTRISFMKTRELREDYERIRARFARKVYVHVFPFYRVGDIAESFDVVGRLALLKTTKER